MTVIPQELTDILASDDEILRGAVRFKGTRLPVQALLDTILCGENVDYFLDDFPDVTRQQALAVLRWEQNKVRHELGVEPAS
ncbi:MAG TPA: DUF433 domain-containing protein [Fimbriimonas sp.]|nr:DUF433 domain-containing protein [Fimbriimonas sp.]